MKILSAAEIAAKERRTKRIGGIVIIALLVLSSLGFALNGVANNNQSQNPDGLTYNGQYWVYSTGGQARYFFTYHPTETNVTISTTKNLGDFSNKPLYIDSEIGGGLEEISNSLGLYSGKVAQACYGECDKDLPEKECSPEYNLIVLRESANSNIREENGCIFLNGDLRTVDAFLYKILGIN